MSHSSPGLTVLSAVKTTLTCVQPAPTHTLISSILATSVVPTPSLTRHFMISRKVESRAGWLVLSCNYFSVCSLLFQRLLYWHQKRFRAHSELLFPRSPHLHGSTGGSHPQHRDHGGGAGRPDGRLCRGYRYGGQL